jgi:hypothetical protein
MPKKCNMYTMYYVLCIMYYRRWVMGGDVLCIIGDSDGEEECIMYYG